MKKFIGFLPALFLLHPFVYSQQDTVRVSSAAVNMISDKEIITLYDEAGDTTYAFKVAEDVVIRHGGQNLTAIKKGAPVMGIVEESALPLKRMKRPTEDDTNHPRWYYKPVYSEVGNGGRLVVRLVAVQAVDGSFILLDNCTIIHVGGEIKSEKGFKAFPVVLKGSPRNCYTTSMKAFVLVKRDSAATASSNGAMMPTTLSGIAKQRDTITIDAPVPIVADKEITAAGVKKGDTVLCFSLAENIVVNNAKYRNYTVAKRGAKVVGVVESALLPYRLKPAPLPPLRELDRDVPWIAPNSLRIGGELSVRFLLVELIDGSFAQLNDCVLRVTGGIAEEKGNLKALAKMPVGSRKSCSTLWPSAVLIVNRMD